MIENQSGLFLVKNVLVTLRHLLHPYGFEIAPFLMGWYQEVVHSCGPGTKNAVGLHPHSVAFCIMSNPDMFDLSFLSHLSSWFRPGVNSFKQAIAPLQPILAQNINAPNRNDLLDWSVFLRLQSSLNACIREVSRSLSAEQQNAIGKVHYFPDYCLTPLPGLPFIHVQASAHVSGLAYFHRPSESMKKVTYKTTLAGCSMHPAYGGWFGLRGIFLFPDCRCSSLPRPQPRSSVPPGIPPFPEDKIEELLREYNTRWRTNVWRNFGLPSNKRNLYSKAARAYFNTMAPRRAELLEDWFIHGHLPE